MLSSLSHVGAQQMVSGDAAFTTTQISLRDPAPTLPPLDDSWKSHPVAPPSSLSQAPSAPNLGKLPSAPVSPMRYDRHSYVARPVPLLGPSSPPARPGRQYMPRVTSSQLNWLGEQGKPRSPLRGIGQPPPRPSGSQTAATRDWGPLVTPPSTSSG